MHAPCSFPAVQVLHLLELVKQWRVSAEHVLEASGLDAGELAEPNRRVPLETMLMLLERARRLTAEPALGIHLGLATRATSYGPLGLATLAAPSLRAAIELAVRYCGLVSTAFSLRFRSEGSQAELILDETVDYGSVRDVLLFSTLLGVRQVGRAMTGQILNSRLDLTIEDPGYVAPFALGEVRFEQPVNRLIFDADKLELPYALRDPAALRLAVELCERQLDSLGLSGRVAGRVRSSIWQPGRGLRSLEEVAHLLHVSERTLKRRLAAEGVSFRTLLEAERRERALSLLASPEMPLSRIAGTLGYASLSNFERAFRRWTSRTPAEYRRHCTVRLQNA
jgi:AraC-like DNA-binding protein